MKCKNCGANMDQRSNDPRYTFWECDYCGGKEKIYKGSDPGDFLVATHVSTAYPRLVGSTASIY